MTGLSLVPKPWDCPLGRSVGERSASGEAVPEGAVERAEVRMRGTSSVVNSNEKFEGRKSKVS